jgi:uncharacterized protein (TIGR02145 family)
MKKYILLLLIIYSTTSFSQEGSMTLSFTGKIQGELVKLDSVIVLNKSNGTDTVLYSPDTILVIYYSSNNIDEIANGLEFSVSQNYPNPFYGSTLIDLYVPKDEHVKLTLRDIFGRTYSRYEGDFNRGKYSFRVRSDLPGMQVFEAQGKYNKVSTKMINSTQEEINSGSSSIEMIGNEPGEFKSLKSYALFEFKPGDQLIHTGFSTNRNMVIVGDAIIHSPLSDTSYIFNMRTGIPCPGLPYIEYEGQKYNTVKIGHQCWFKENLNVGTYITTLNYMHNNGVLEKYCYDNNQSNCDIYGGLYQWNEIMQYNPLNERGICPTGWHIATDLDWKILEGTVDSLYNIGSTEWNKMDEWRGYDIGIKLKAETNWISSGNSFDNVGFTALPGGFAYSNLEFVSLEEEGRWWTSTKEGSSSPILRALKYNSSQSQRTIIANNMPCSVRCVKD